MMTLPAFPLALTDSLTIDCLTVSQLDDVMRLQQQVYGARLPWSRFAFRSELERTKSAVYVGLYQYQHLVGVMGLDFKSVQALHVMNLLVAPDYQHHGMATLLLKWAQLLAQQNQRQNLTLEVRADNDKAHRLYQYLGYHDVQVCQHYYVQDDMTAIKMKQELDGDGK